MNFFTSNAQHEYTWQNVGKAIIDIFMNEKITTDNEQLLEA